MMSWGGYPVVTPPKEDACKREDCKRHREALELMSASPFLKGIQAIGIARDALKPPKDSK
jgi:hypothetical protein